MKNETRGSFDAPSFKCAGDVIAHIVGPCDPDLVGRRVLDHELVGQQLWVAESIRMGKRWRTLLVCYTIRCLKRRWGYINVTELNGPFHLTVPMRLLDAVPIANARWRQRVLDRQAKVAVAA